jgi:hypothetical protein
VGTLKKLNDMLLKQTQHKESQANSAKKVKQTHQGAKQTQQRKSSKLIKESQANSAMYLRNRIRQTRPSLLLFACLLIGLLDFLWVEPPNVRVEGEGNA